MAKKCKICRKEYEPFSSLQKVCSPPCAIELVNSDKAKAERRRAKERRKDTRERREKLKTRSDWLNEAQVACNAYIRELEKDEPCISCGTTKPDIQYCAGHYKTRGGHPELRFHPVNIHKQCNQYCNLQLSGNISAYRPRLIEKVGLAMVEWLEGPHEPQNWTIEDAKEIKQYYREQLRYLIKQRNEE